MEPRTSFVLCSSLYTPPEKYEYWQMVFTEIKKCLPEFQNERTHENEVPIPVHSIYEY